MTYNPLKPAIGQAWQRALRRGIATGADVCEIGVFRGDTLALMAIEAHRAGVIAHGIDSWEGMAPPGPRDDDNYPAGKFGLGGRGGMGGFHRGMVQRGVGRDWYCCWQGWVPEIFEQLPPIAFGFVHIDLDQYQPTLDAARWAWPRIVSGGVMAFHDYFPGVRQNAAAAVAEWIREGKCSDYDREGTELIAYKPEM